MQRYFAPTLAGVTGIRFRSCIFSEPVRLSRWTPPRSAGLFAILIPDCTWAPRPFRPIYFGAFTGHLHGVSPEEYLAWFRAAAGKDPYVAFYEAPFSSACERTAAQQELILAYQPLCNRGRGSEAATGVAQRLEALERKIQEQETLLRVAIAAAGRLLEPQPEPRRRAIGFTTPASTPATATGT